MMKKKTQPEIIVVGGPNGSGKTTIAREILAERELLYISADDIAYQISPDNPEKVKVEAGKIFFVRLAEAVELKHDILIESTLAGKSLVSWLKKLKSVSNYKVSIVFIFLTNPEVCSQRVSIRVKKGGHHVPTKDIFRRFGRSIINFWDLYKKTADLWYLYYTSEDSFQEVARKTEDELYVLNEKLFVTFEELRNRYEQK